MRYLIVLPLVLLLAVVWQAGAEESSVEASRKAAKRTEGGEGCVTCCEHAKSLPPCHCLVELLYDYPGPYDLYYCFTHPNDCYEGVGELWYGRPANPFWPQVCDWNQCERYMGYREGEVVRVPGHELDLTAEQARSLAEATQNPDLEVGEPEFHKITPTNVPMARGKKGDIFIMAVPIQLPEPPVSEDAKGESAAARKSGDTKSKEKTKTYYICMQIDSLEGEEETEAVLDDSMPQTGRQFYIWYTVDGEDREGLVWLKQ